MDFGLAGVLFALVAFFALVGYTVKKVWKDEATTHRRDFCGGQARKELCCGQPLHVTPTDVLWPNAVRTPVYRLGAGRSLREPMDTGYQDSPQPARFRWDCRATGPILGRLWRIENRRLGV
jgi:hypothetical protein